MRELDNLCQTLEAYGIDWELADLPPGVESAIVQMPRGRIVLFTNAAQADDDGHCLRSLLRAAAIAMSRPAPLGALELEPDKPWALTVTTPERPLTDSEAAWERIFLARAREGA